VLYVFGTFCLPFLLFRRQVEVVWFVVKTELLLQFIRARYGCFFTGMDGFVRVYHVIILLNHPRSGRQGR